MPRQRKPAAPSTGPKHGRKPGYAEEQPRSPGHAQQPAEPSQPTPDEPGMERDPDPPPHPRKPE